MKKVKRRSFSGVVLEQEIYYVSDKDAKRPLSAKPRLRFKNDAEREKHKDGILLRAYIREVNATFTPKSLVSHLTIDDEHLITDWDEAKKMRRNWARRIKYRFPDAKLHIVLGGGKKERIHIHMISDGVPADWIIKNWNLGKIKKIENLRSHNIYNNVDHGQDYSGLAIYLWKNWTPEQGGHHVLKTKNTNKADREDAEESKRNYTPEKPPKAPEGYLLVEYMSTPYGYSYFKYIKFNDDDYLYYKEEKPLTPRPFNGL